MNRDQVDEIPQRAADCAFLSDGGEMGALMRAYPWETTPLGPPADWPQSLRSMVSVCLNSPMLGTILWGQDLLMLYNDAYLPALADRHPAALGRPIAGIWGATWAFVAEPFLRTMATGEGFSQLAVAVPMIRRGQAVTTYWDLTAAPIRGEGGDVAGLFCQGVEITERVAAEKTARDSAERLEQALAAGEGVGTWDWDVPADRVRSDARFARLYGVPADVAEQGAPIADFFRRIHPDDMPAVEVAVADAIRTGGLFAEEYRLVDDRGEIRWVLARGECRLAPDGTPQRFPGVSFDITARKRAEARQAALLELSDRLHDLTDPSEIAFSASEVLGKTLAVSRAGYAVVDLSAGTITIARDWHVPDVATLAGVHHFSDFGTFIEDLARGETVVIADIAADERTADSVAQLAGIGIRAFVNLPLIEQGQVVAVLFANHHRPHAWAAEDLVVMREVAERVRAATERARSDEALRVSERDLRLALAAGRFGPWKLDLVTGVLDATPMCRFVYGRDPDVPFTYAALRECVHPDDRDRRQRVHEAAVSSGNDYDVEYRIVTPEGEIRWVAVRAQVAYTEEGRPRVLTGISTDITEGKRLEEALGALNTDLERRVEDRSEQLLKTEEALRQSQKMEAVGQLTGGIAHDFNNLLQGITGSLQIATRRVAQGRTDDLDRFLSGAITSANRAAALTHRLLAFSRRQPLDPRPVQANDLIASLEELFRRTTGEAIELLIVRADNLWGTLCDPNQLESALLNLVINARDAMAGGGKLVIETANASVDPAYAASKPSLRSGDYVCISVTDTGSGMSAETIAKAFEPFFTTKPIGQGTGLGLSMVYGFAGQSEGQVTIYSEIGKGTTIKLYLPRHQSLVERETELPGPPRDRRAADGDTVLVIEDEAIVRGVIVEILRELGYDAIQAADGHKGLEILRSKQRVDLLITDIGLPGLDGRGVAEAARRERPALKILFMTGYAENAALASGFLDRGMAMVTKPIAIDILATRIREMIEAA